MPPPQKNTPQVQHAIDRAALQQFLQDNPMPKLAKINLSAPSIQWRSGKDAQEALLSQLKALQRLIRLTENLDQAIALYEAGLHSAMQLAAMPQQKFVQQYGALVGGEKAAPKIHQRALAKKSQVLHTYMRLAQNNSPYYQALRVSNAKKPVN